MPRIASLHAREILDSRGFPTVEVEAALDDGSVGRASVPSGASTGVHESHELRDGDQTRFKGKGVLQAVAHVNDELNPALVGKDAFDQTELDDAMRQQDCTESLEKYGANAILGISLAVSKAAAVSQHIPYYQHIRQIYSNLAAQSELQLPELIGFPLPTPMFNILNGGAHTDWQTTDFQEFMVIPQQAATFKIALEQGAAVYHSLEILLQEKGLTSLVGDEGGFAPELKGNDQAMELIVEAISAAGFRPGVELSLGIDAATSELYKDGMYSLKVEGVSYNTQDMIELWQSWSGKFPLISLEDGLSEDDWSGWMAMGKQLDKKMMLVGDDLLVTNPERIRRAIDTQACNALLMKVNQIGTLTESLRALQLARSAGWKIVVSHRSGETEDTSIADIAVGVSAEYVKVGAPARSERTAKYNQLLRIEEAVSSSGT